MLTLRKKIQANLDPPCPQICPTHFYHVGTMQVIKQCIQIRHCSGGGEKHRYKFVHGKDYLRQGVSLRA